jgi:hypothetical protein
MLFWLINSEVDHTIGDLQQKAPGFIKAVVRP